MFDDASSWWSTQQVILPDSKEIEDMIEEKMGEQKESVEEEPWSSMEVKRHTQSPWQTGVHQREQRELQDEEEEVKEQPLLRRSTRQRKPNPKYANVAEVMEEKEPTTYEDGLQKKEWIKSSNGIRFLEFRKQLRMHSRTSAEGEKSNVNRSSSRDFYMIVEEPRASTHESI